MLLSNAVMLSVVFFLAVKPALALCLVLVGRVRVASPLVQVVALNQLWDAQLAVAPLSARRGSASAKKQSLLAVAVSVSFSASRSRNCLVGCTWVPSFVSSGFTALGLLFLVALLFSLGSLGVTSVAGGATLSTSVAGGATFSTLLPGVAAGVSTLTVFAGRGRLAFASPSQSLVVTRPEVPSGFRTSRGWLLAAKVVTPSCSAALSATLSAVLN